MSKYLEYTRYANTGATKDVAPVLGTFLNRDKLALEALCEEIKLNGGTPMDTETLLYIISGTIDYLREQYALRCVRYRLYGITFEVACYGPFSTSDAKFDPAVNSLEVAVRLGEELKNCLVNEVPKLVTEESATTARIYRAMDIASGALGIIIGTRSFRVTGRNVYVSREGEYLKLQDGKGRMYDLVYDKVESPSRVECHLAENLLESGTCKLILCTYAGDESEDAKLSITDRVVSFVKFEEAPTIDRIVSEGADGIVKGEAFAAIGSHLSFRRSAGDSVKVKWTDEGGEEHTLDLEPTATDSSRISFDAVEAFEDIPDDTELTFEFELSGETVEGETRIVGA